jgi:Polysaccharide lyase
MAHAKRHTFARRLRLTVVAVLVLAFLGLPGVARGAATWVGGFETGNLSQWSTILAKPGGVRVVRSPHRSGRFAARFVAGPGDYYFDTDRSRKRNRSELVYDAPDRVGREGWYAWSILFPAGFQASMGHFNVFTQFKDFAGSVNSRPVISLGLKTTVRPVQIFLKTNGGGRCGGRGCSNYTKTLGRLRRGVWEDYVLHVKWSVSPQSGLVEVWRNRRLVARARTATMYSDTYRSGVKFKQGIYRGETRTTSVLYIDATRRLTRMPAILRRPR